MYNVIIIILISNEILLIIMCNININNEIIMKIIVIMAIMCNNE